MIKIAAVALIVAMSSPALAESTPPHTSVAEKPIDKGPTTPAANNAYQGGGVVLQGAPGAPAPTPKPTPAGQAPAESLEMLPSQSSITPPSKATDD